MIFILTCFKNKITKFFPTFKLTRFDAWEKKHILDMSLKFKKCEGGLIEFCKAIGKSYDTIHGWQTAYDRYGIAGLYDKKTRQYHFSCKIPKWLKEQLLILFLRFPQWTPYQYYQYLKNNPAIQKTVSIPTIKKMKEIHTTKSAAEKERIKKRWCFAENFQVWSVDFTCIEKTDKYKLQLLTVSDQRSRFLLESALCLETSTERVMDHLEELFIKYGKPFLIKVDNGPEFRLDFKENLRELSVYLLNSPRYYPKFDGAHERIHRSLKTYISDFFEHKNLTRLVKEIDLFTDEHNHHMTFEYLEGKTPAQIFYSDEDFVAKNIEVVKPYVKEGELRMKFTNRQGELARLALPQIT
jgi:transposase InsO family protein